MCTSNAMTGELQTIFIQVYITLHILHITGTCAQIMHVTIDKSETSRFQYDLLLVYQ